MRKGKRSVGIRREGGKLYPVHPAARLDGEPLVTEIPGGITAQGIVTWWTRAYPYGDGPARVSWAAVTARAEAEGDKVDA